MSTDDTLLVSVSGIRGVVGRGLTPEKACAFAAALGTFLEGGRVVLSRDGRSSGEALRHAALAGLLGTGCDVLDIGVAPTPTCGLAVRHLQAAGGLQITASHNPAEWNGLKMFGPDGAVLSAADGRKVRELFEEGRMKYAPWDGVGALQVPPDPGEEHLRRACDQVSVAAIHASRFRVFLDANGGAGGPLAVRLLRELGCEVIEYACNADGRFEHEPEPIPAHLADVAPLVRRAGAAVGFVLDPDADRLALIDENGECLSEELTLALAVRHRLGQQPGPVVVNMSTSRAVEDIAAEAGGTCERSAVGEANVVARMREVGAVLGGEGNGGVIDPRVGWVRDPFVGMAMILDLLAAQSRSLSEIVASLPRYAMVKAKAPVPRERLADGLAALRRQWPDARANELDGLRLDWPDRWVHVRPSNTEPVVRVIAEAPEADQAEALSREAASLLAG
ncbi:MAG TPA: phosphoglucosamine mutase [Gemmataceae bacterium]